MNWVPLDANEFKERIKKLQQEVTARSAACSELNEELAYCQKQNKEMKKLLKQVVTVMDSKEYEGQVMMSHIHGYTYNGPKINMKQIREILGMEPKEGDWGED